MIKATSNWFFGFMTACLILSACVDKNEEVTVDNGVGELSINLDLDEEISTSNSRSEAVNTDSFSISIIHFEGDTIATFEHVINIPETLKLPAGKYFITAKSDSLYPARYEAPYYWGKSELIEVITNQVTSATVVCSLANTMISIQYSEQVKQNFSEYDAWVKVGNDSLYFSQDESRPGYFFEGPIETIAKLYSSGSTEPILVQGLIESPKVKHHYIITIDGYDLSGAVRPIDIVTDSTVGETNITFSNTTIHEGLVAYYPLDGNANDSISHFDGAVSGAVSTIDRNEQLGKAFYFDGVDDFITMGDVLDSVFAGPDQAFSFAFWMQPDTVKKQIILAKSADTNCDAEQRQFHLKLTTENKLEFASIFDPGFHHSHRSVSSTVALDSTSDWMHVAVTYDGSSDENDGLSRVTMFVNGVKITTQFSSVQRELSHIKDSEAHLSLGNQINSEGENCGQNNFQGKLDDVRIYNRPLTENEVGILMSIGTIQ